MVLLTTNLNKKQQNQKFVFFKKKKMEKNWKKLEKNWNFFYKQNWKN